MAFVLTWLVALQVHASLTPSGPPARARAECAADMRVDLVYPRGFGITPAKFQDAIRAHPQLEPTLRQDLHFAQFLLEEGQPFLTLLGIYAHLGLDEERLRSYLAPLRIPATPATHRIFLIEKIMQLGVEEGIYPATLVTAFPITFFYELLGPLPLAERIRFDNQFFSRFGTAEDYVRLAEKNQFKMRDLVLHSNRAQHALLALCKASVHVRPAAGVAGLRRRLAGAAGVEMPHEKCLLDEAMAALDKKNFASYAIADRRRLRQKFEAVHMSESLQSYFVMLRENISGFSPEALARMELDSPFNLMAALSTPMDLDTFMDQGLNPPLARFFIEHVLKQRMTSGAEIAEKVKTRIRQILDELRFFWRTPTPPPVSPAASPAAGLGPPAASAAESWSQSPSAFVAPPAAPRAETPITREERLRRYAARATTSPTPESERAPVEVTLSNLFVPHPPPEARFWKDLADPARSLAEARTHLAAQIRPEEVYRIPVLRTGYTYRVSFSAKLLDQIVNPRGGEPEDPRLWIKALRMGTAAENSQNGWRKTTPPIDGLYFWEIKLRSSNYRILGNKGGGVWKFATIQRTH